MGSLPGWGEVPQLAPAPKLLEPGHPVGVLCPGNGAPVLELDELLGQMGDVVPRSRQFGGEVLGPDLHLVPLLGCHQHGQDGGVDRGGGLDGPPEYLELGELLGVEEALVQRRPSADYARRPVGLPRTSDRDRGPSVSRISTEGAGWIECLRHRGQRTQWLRRRRSRGA